jgi:hypothetical protein
VSTYFDDFIRLNTQRIADLKKTTEDLEREISEARVSLELERELAESARFHEPAHGARFRDRVARAGFRPPLAGSDCHEPPVQELFPEPPVQAAFPDPPGQAVFPEEPGQAAFPEPPAQPAFQDPDVRTAKLVTHGRRTAYHRGLSRISKVAAGTVVGAVLVTVLVLVMSRGGPSWPPSVAVVKSQVDRACRNPDVRSEPGLVNFACGKDTRQILWVFALLTSGNNPSFADPTTGRQGLEPISPVQGGEVAASLNLHHPYDPSNPVDSIQVAARALNDIIGGATVISANGTPVVQPGLESSAKNCRRYTGSATLDSRQGYPDVCASPVTSPQGQAALVADVYRKWIVGAAAKEAQDAAVLFQNADNPANPRVQAILKSLPAPRLSS